MGDTTTNLKVRFGAETKNFRKDLESGKAAVDNFSGGAQSSLARFASVFGINLDAVSEKFKAFKQGLFFIVEAVKGAIAASKAKAFSDALSAAASEKAAIANAAEALAASTATTATQSLTAAMVAEALAMEAGAGATALQAAAQETFTKAMNDEVLATEAATAAKAAKLAATESATAAGTKYVSTLEAQSIADKAAAQAATVNATATTATATATNAATKGSYFWAAALKILKLAIISTGIGAFIVALGSLIAYFTQTERGAEAIERVMASVKAVFRVVTDQASALGETIVNAFKNPKETIIELWEFIKSQFVNRIVAIPLLIESAWKIVKGIFTGGVVDAAKEMGSATIQLITGLDKVQQSKVADKVTEVGKAMGDAAAKGWDLAAANQALEDRERALIEVQAERKRKIEELRLAAKDLTLTEEERLKKLSEAIEIEKAFAADSISLQREKVRIAEEQFKMAEKRDEAETNLRNERAKLSELEAQSLSTIRGMSREYNTLTKSIEDNAEAARKARNLEDIGTEDEKPMKKMDPYKPPKNYEWKLITDEKGLEHWAKILNEPLETDKLEASANKVKSILGDLKITTIDIGGAIESAMNNLAVSFGENLGLLLAGADGAKGIGEILGSAFGDMLVSIGKATIGAGTAFLAMSLMFKAGIATPGAAIAAIAAGIALVAIGTAFKTSVASAASGGGGTFSSAGSGNNSSIGVSSAGVNSYRSSPMTINITGTFRQQGRDLVAVIEKEGNIKKIST
ncbi:MAG: hypothetical protein Q8S54_19835 [Bacteroidota bacterium]|nr:hypothetical protein [Bacteroidota bacterium]